MTKTEVIAIVLRLFAIVIAFHFLWKLPGGVYSLTEQAGQLGTYTGLGYIFSLLAIACLLWFFPFTIAKKILPTVESDLAITSIEKNTLIEVGIILIGLFYLFYALSDIFYWLFFILASIRMENTYGDMLLTADQWSGIIVTLIEITMALFLIFGAKGVKNLIYSFRKR